MASAPITAWQIEGEKGKVVTDSFFMGSKITADWWLRPWNQKMIASWQESNDTLRHYSANKVHSQGYGLPSGHVRLWKLDRKESRMPKNWCLQSVVLEKTPISPLDSKEIKPVNLKGYQPWIFTARTDAEAEAPVFWSSDANRQLIGKVPDAGRDCRQKEKRALEDEMQWTRTWSNSGKWWGTGRPGMLQALDRKESEMTGWLNNSKLTLKTEEKP